ncbi:MAG TPA: DUF6141 family protein [Prolixibacteraceae bacterium]|nr:DUF6141 family protein [Prolixibacteraceae bacterium]
MKINTVFFKETQQFRQWWFIVAILIAIIPSMIFSIYALFQQTVRGIQVGDNPAPNAVLIVLFFAMGMMLWLFFSMKLEVSVDKDGIHYRFSPLISKTKLILKEEIHRFEIRKYSPILDYGGWGIKKRFKWGRAYNVSGNIGLQLYLKNGRKVLFGTQRSQALMYAMEKMMKSK